MDVIIILLLLPVAPDGCMTCALSKFSFFLCLIFLLSYVCTVFVKLYSVGVVTEDNLTVRKVQVNNKMNHY